MPTLDREAPWAHIYGSETFITATGECKMSAHISADVRALFGDHGIEFENAAAVEAGLVIDRFELWGDTAGTVVPMRGTICRVDVLEAA
jgi:hypothetical protein